VLADMGSAHSAHGFLLGRGEEYTTAYSRAPERWLGLALSHSSIDIWALGSLAAAMALGHCPWMTLPDTPGPEALAEFFRCWISLLGPPGAEYDGLPKRALLPKPTSFLEVPFFEELGRMRPLQGGPLRDAANFAQACCRWDPKLRPTAAQALQSFWPSSHGRGSRPASSREEPCESEEEVVDLVGSPRSDSPAQAPAECFF
jgi:serine/threonine protein kinase